MYPGKDQQPVLAISCICPEATGWMDESVTNIFSAKNCSSQSVKLDIFLSVIENFKNLPNIIKQTKLKPNNRYDG